MIDETTLASYAALVATHPELERKGKTMPYTSINGNMFSFLMPDGTLALRLSSGDRVAFVEQYGTEPVEQHGAVLKEYATVPGDLLHRLEELAPWFDRSLAHAVGLKPKKTARSG